MRIFLFIIFVFINIKVSFSIDKNAIAIKLDATTELLHHGIYGDSVRKILNPILKEVLASNDSILINRVYNQIGVSYAQEENYTDGLAFFYKSADYSISLKDKASTYHNIAVIHKKMGNNEKAIELIKYAIDLSEKINDSVSIAKSSLFRSIIEGSNDNYQEAIKDLNKALEIAEKMNLVSIKYNCYNNLGVNEFKKFNYKKSLSFFLQAKKCAEEMDRMNQLAFTNANMAGAYFRLNNKDSAIYCINNALSLVDKYETHIETEMTVYNLASEIFLQYGDLAKSIVYDDRFEVLRDSLKSKNQISDYLAVELDNVKDENIEIINNKGGNKVLLFIVISIVVILLFILFKYYAKPSIAMDTLENTIEVESRVSLNELSLTKREKEIALLVLKGKSSPEISGKLFISVNTVNSHRKNIYKKAEVSSLSQFILNYQE